MKRLEQFISNNPNVMVDNDDEKVIVYNCWEDPTFRFSFSIEERVEVLNNLIFHKELCAIYHQDCNLYEFIYLPLSYRYERCFSYNFHGSVFKLYYGVPTESFQMLATHMDIIDSPDVPEWTDRTFYLFRYKRFYKTDAEGDSSKIYPTNFFIKGNFDTMSYEDHLAFFRHVNFMMSYYDRQSPYIIINDKAEEISDIKVPCKSKTGVFPGIIQSDRFDTTLLELMAAAKDSSSFRLKYLFYFQVLEYCSYYYIENRLKRQVSNIIKSPDILFSNDYSDRIIELYSDYLNTNKDEKRMERLLMDLCEYEDIKDELLVNSNFFIKDLVFDGGFTVKSLFNNKDEIDNPPKEIIITIRRNIDRIRNVLVHARESREKVEIKPTYRNVQLLKPYLYLLQRIAETVIIKY